MEIYNAIIKEGKERNLFKHHPWVFSGAIEKITPEFTLPYWAEVYSSAGYFIAHGWYDPKSHIALRLISWDRKEKPGEELVKNLILESVRRRSNLFRLEGTNAFRIIYGDADFLPGIVADVYAREIRVIISSRFGYYFRYLIRETLLETLRPDRLSIAIDPNYAGTEGLKNELKIYDREGNKIEDDGKNTKFTESDIYYEIDGFTGQKSGFYLDQRDNRNIVEWYANDRNVLDAFSYTGSFTLHALRGGAKSVLALDSSESSLRHLLYQVNINEEKKAIPEGSRERVQIEKCDVFQKLREIEEDKYDLIILDPPKLANTKSALERAEKAYKDINRLAMEKIRDGGILATFSCSGAMTRENFRMMVSWASNDARVECQILNTLSQSEDHPVRIAFPESEYLVGLVLRIIKK